MRLRRSLGHRAAENATQEAFVPFPNRLDGNFHDVGFEKDFPKTNASTD